MMTQKMIAEAARFNTTVENLMESGFIWLENTYGDSHWFANDESGTLQSLAWYREQQRKTREFRKNHPQKRVESEGATMTLDELKKLMMAA